MEYNVRAIITINYRSWSAAIGARKALDVVERVLLLISTQLPWGSELFDYTDFRCPQVHFITKSVVSEKLNPSICNFSASLMDLL